jgi:hypothetical protein
MRDGSLARSGTTHRSRAFLPYCNKYEDDMTDHQANLPHKSLLSSWFGPNRNTHWTIAGSVAVIMLGGYLVYSNRDSSPTPGTPTSAAEPSPPPMGPAPLKSAE